MDALLDDVKSRHGRRLEVLRAGSFDVMLPIIAPSAATASPSGNMRGSSGLTAT